MRSTVPSSVTSGPAGAEAESVGTAASSLDMDAYRVPPAALVARTSCASSAPQLSAVPTPGAPGMCLYERHAFQTVGIYHEQGMLDGRWIDVILMERMFT